MQELLLGRARVHTEYPIRRGLTVDNGLSLLGRANESSWVGTGDGESGILRCRRIAITGAGIVARSPGIPPGCAMSFAVLEWVQDCNKTVGIFAHVMIAGCRVRRGNWHLRLIRGGRKWVSIAWSCGSASVAPATHLAPDEGLAGREAPSAVRHF